MVLFTLLDISLNVLWWSCKQSYNIGYYFMYGTQQTDNELLLLKIENLENKINLLVPRKPT